MTSDLMLGMESVCLAFLLVILAAYCFLPRTKKLRSDWFFISLVLTIIGLVCDMIAWESELRSVPYALQYAGNLVAQVMTSLIVSAFGYYVIELINEKEHLSYAFAHVVSAINCTGVVVSVIAACCGLLFDIHPLDTNPDLLVFNGGPLYSVCMITSAVSLAALFVLILRYSKALGKKKTSLITIYFLLPLITSIMEVFFEDLLLSYIAVCVSITIVYILLQSSHMNELKMREKLLNEISYVDQLTGLLNRRACDRDVAAIKKDDKVGIVFCDLNGLKQINDEKGHRAGDQFLITFANIISKYFSHDSVYRISGDEFVVVARNMEPDQFEDRISQLRQEIDDNAGIAALGTISGMGDTIPMLVKKAEMGMYADKKNFYRHNPDYKRGKSAYMDDED
ncbi:MAG: hypothetical protein CW338_10875 [Clostridiales bacterium]|nr:hypothetical protein [Clostridiales bacterium]